MSRKINDQELLDLLKQGISRKEIASHFGCSAPAITKRLKRLLPVPDSLRKLSPKEQRFALAVSQGKTQTQACLESFEVTSRESAKALGSALAAKPAVKIAITELMEQKGIGREVRISKLSDHVHSVDPLVSLKALDMAMKLSGDDLEAKTQAVTQESEKGIFADLTGYTPVAEIARHTEWKGGERCVVCKETAISEGMQVCGSCVVKYPELTDKLTRYWAGDICAACDDPLKGYEYCTSCHDSGSNTASEKLGASR